MRVDAEQVEEREHHAHLALDLEVREDALQRLVGRALVRVVEVVHAEELRLVVRVELLDGEEVLHERAHHARRVVEEAVLEARRKVVERRGLPLERRREGVVHLGERRVERLEHLRAEGGVVERVGVEGRELVARHLRQLGAHAGHQLLPLVGEGLGHHQDLREPADDLLLVVDEAVEDGVHALRQVAQLLVDAPLVEPQLERRQVVAELVDVGRRLGDERRVVERRATRASRPRRRSRWRSPWRG